MKLVTLTVDLDTHAVVPKLPTEEWQLGLAKGRCEWDTGLDVIADVIAAAPPYQSEHMLVGFIDHGGIFYTYKDMPKNGIQLYGKAAPNGEEP